MGVQPRVLRFAADDGADSTIVAAAEGWPSQGNRTALTLDASADGLGLGREEYELLMVGSAGGESVVDMVGNLALAVRAHRLIPAHGAIWENALLGLIPNASLRHALLVRPILGDAGWIASVADGTQVRWLQIVPITNDELALAASFTVDRLLRSFRAHGTRWDDLSRDTT